jgi:hypothetical protein
MSRWYNVPLILAIVATCAVLADNFTTTACFSLLGNAVHEMNPLTRYLIGHWGVVPTMFINALWGIVLIAWLMLVTTERHSYVGVFILVAIIFLRSWGAINNYHILITHS